jgi:HAE1 family hydrophobic/amphiphilic exporter-1
MKKIIAAFILTMGLAAAMAQTNAPTRSLSLQDCIAAALQHNFDVQVARYNPQVSLYELYATYSGYDPLFNISGTHSYNKTGLVEGLAPTNFFINTYEQDTYASSIAGGTPWGMTYDFVGNVSKSAGSSVPVTADNNFNGSSGQVGVDLKQPLLKNLWIDSTRLQISVAKNNLKYSEQGLRSQLITTVAAIETAYYELIYDRENLQVQQEALTLSQTQLDQDKQRMQIGTLAQLAVQLDESQAAQNKANVISAEFTLASGQNTLKNLITDDYKLWHDTDIAPSESLDAAQQLFDLQDSWSKGMTERPDLLQARLTLEQQGIQLKFDRNQLYPELDLVGSYGYNGAGNDFQGSYDQFGQANRPYYSYGAQMSIPLANVQARNTLKSDKVTKAQDLLKLKQLEQNILVQIDNAVKQAQSAWESVDATKQARIYAEAALDAEQKTYAVGKATTFEVLQYQNNLTAARSQEIRALANYEEALSNLAQQEGSTLQRRGLDIEVK